MPLSFNLPPHAASSAETALTSFLIDHIDPIVEAAALLGARPAVQRTTRLFESILDASHISRRLRREIIGLHRLLSLQCVDDTESVEAACFADIDPASPVVEDICILADMLWLHLSALAETDEDGPLWDEFSDVA